MTEAERRWRQMFQVVGFCPECKDEFYVPHGGKCPAEHWDLDEAPDLIEYVPLARALAAEHGRDYYSRLAAKRWSQAERPHIWIERDENGDLRCGDEHGLLRHGPGH